MLQGLTPQGLVLRLGAVRHSIVILTTELLEGLAGSLGNEQSSEATDEHEKSIDLENVVHPGCRILSGSTMRTESGDGTLADDGSDLARGSRDTVASGTVARWEGLTGDDEGCGVGTCNISISMCLGCRLQGG